MEGSASLNEGRHSVPQGMLYTTPVYSFFLGNLIPGVYYVGVRRCMLIELRGHTTHLMASVVCARCDPIGSGRFIHHLQAES